MGFPRHAARPEPKGMILPMGSPNQIEWHITPFKTRRPFFVLQCLCDANRKNHRGKKLNLHHKKLEPMPKLQKIFVYHHNRLFLICDPYKSLIPLNHDLKQLSLSLHIPRPQRARMDEPTVTEKSPLAVPSLATRLRAIAPLLPPVLQSFAYQFISGINDGNLGIMLPSIKAHYGLTQYVVSIIFLCNAFGYIMGKSNSDHHPYRSTKLVLAAFSNGYLVKYISQSKTALFGSCVMIVGYMVVLFAVPFPVMCIFMIFIGFGVALTQSSSNVVCGEMPHSTLMLSFLHGTNSSPPPYPLCRLLINMGDG